MARIPEPTVQQLEKRRVTAEAKRTITELMNRINDSNLTENERLEAGQNLDRLVELQAPGVEEALKQINNEETAKTLLYFTPGIGQAMAAGELVLNPTWENAGWAALSIVPFARGGVRTLKSLGAIKGAKKFGDDITREIKNALETARNYIRKPAQKTKVGSVAGAKGDAGDFGTSGFADDIAGARRAKAASDRKTAAEAAERKAAGIAKGQRTRKRNIANKGLRKGAPVTGPVGLGGAAYMTSQLMDGEEPQQPREYLGPYSPEYYSDLPLVPMPTETSPEEPQPGLQLPMPGQEEEPEGSEDTRTPWQKRRFLPRRPGQGSQGRLRRNPRYVPPPGGEEAEADVEQRPELPMTGVPGEQPEAIPDMTPTDQDIEGLFNGEGMPERFQDDPSRHAASVAFRRERDKAFGRFPDTSMEGASGLYEEPEGVDFIDTPEGQALLQNRMTPMSPEEQAPPGGIDPLTQGVARIPVSPTPSDRDRDGAADRLYETPGMTPRVPPQMPLPETGPTPSPDQRIQDLPRLMPELGRQMRPEVPSPESPEDRIEEDPTLIKEDVLDDLATMRPQDAGPPTDDDIVGLFEGRNVPVSQLSREEAQTQLDQMKAKFEEQPGLGMTQEDEKRFKELMKVLKWKPITAGSDWSVVPWESR